MICLLHDSFINLLALCSFNSEYKLLGAEGYVLFFQCSLKVSRDIDH